MHHLAAGDASMDTSANNQGSRAREVAQCLQGSFGPALLNDGNRHHNEHKAEQHRGIGGLAHDEIQRPRSNEHEKHRFTSDLESDGEQASLLLRGEFVRPARCETRPSVLLAEPGETTKIEDVARAPPCLCLHTTNIEPWPTTNH